MISTLSPASQQFVNNLNRIIDQTQKAQLQVSSGLKVSQVSDAPDQISTLLQARSNLAGTNQIIANLGRTKAETDAGEQALQSAVTLMDRVQTLAAEGVNSTQTADSRAALALEAGSVLEQMGGLASTQVEGRYIFSGGQDQPRPYTIDLTQLNPVSAYQGSASTRVAQHPNGSTFPVALTAQTIFDSADPTTNVFQAVQAVRSALNANDDAAIQTAYSGLSKVASYLNSQLATYGTVQNKVANATDFGQTLQLQLQTQISGIQDADLTQSIIQLQQGQIQEQAALQTQAQIPRKTLFDYLA
jgi:flagellar hook-associated protein 3 FlgL